ncbi:LacI family transcriptional regulator [Rhodococcoides trifolii]|uniref:LacI family transcriptional regulator n=1 Tax=Rhodococcoides trifolii TaxID=908250 RepID=A0A917FP08_9NOCA|nr:LacI family DNA-binding transcriptional regulator [Rhodococcus trifolii]GGF96774.1 LacI family transcriptional regulator [Rhodococcus trifolii]
MANTVTMAEVAKAAGVSLMSVSYAFGQPDRVSDATRLKVREAAERLGYTGPHRGAQSLRRGTTNNLGVVLTEKLSYAFDDAQARQYLSGIADACLDTDTGLVLLPNARIGRDVERIRDAHVDGFVLWTTVSDDPVLDAVVGTGKPVCIQGGPRHPGTAFVGIDDVRAAIDIATLGLVGSTRPAVLSFPMDHRRAAGVVHGPDPDDATFPVTRHRLAGYRQAVTAAGLSWDETPVAFVPSNIRDHGAAAARNILGATDALLAMSDELAFGASDVAAEMSLHIPDDFSLTGWDDSAAAATAGLTTVAQSLYDQGRAAARFVLGQSTTIDEATFRVVVRSSTR